MRRAAALTLVLVLAGCGTPSADLFAVDRSGSVPGARLRLVISDGGTVTCNGARPVDLPDTRLLDARELQRDLKDDAERHLELRPRPGSVLTYRVRTPDGTLRFSDNSRGATAALDRVALFVREVAQQQCRLPR